MSRNSAYSLSHLDVFIQIARQTESTCDTIIIPDWKGEPITSMLCKVARLWGFAASPSTKRKKAATPSVRWKRIQGTKVSTLAVVVIVRHICAKIYSMSSQSHYWLNDALTTHSHYEFSPPKPCNWLTYIQTLYDIAPLGLGIWAPILGKWA